MACRLGSMLLSLVLLGTFLAGCAGTPSPEALAQNDPYESFNRKMFNLNEKLDRNVALPAAKAYVWVLPKPLRDGVHNGLTNLSEPVTLANDVLQADGIHAAQTLGRTIVNSTIGLAGIIDVATPLGIPAHEEDFGETLATWGVAEGPYLVLPFLGPSNPRDAGGHFIDIAFDPLTYIGMREKGWWMAGRNVLGIIDERAENIDTMEQIEKSSVDLYATMRSLYRQHRAAEIRGGEPDLQNLPNI